MTDKQFKVMQKQLDNVQTQISEGDKRLSNKIEAVHSELFNKMFRNKLELSKLIKDNAEINGREHQRSLQKKEWGKVDTL